MEMMSEDAKAILLLCGQFDVGGGEVPLNQKEYNSVVKWLLERKSRPHALLDPSYIDSLAEGEAFTRVVADWCGRIGLPVVSGGARGVDSIAMASGLEAGGIVVGILADSLLRKSVSRDARDALADGRLVLVSPYHPEAGFNVGNAMGRNKLIYAMADYGLVVSAEHNKGGTWEGAIEELKREPRRPVFVRISGKVPSGNRKLLELGAVAFPDVTLSSGCAS